MIREISPELVEEYQITHIAMDIRPVKAEPLPWKIADTSAVPPQTMIYKDAPKDEVVGSKDSRPGSPMLDEVPAVFASISSALRGHLYKSVSSTRQVPDPLRQSAQSLPKGPPRTISRSAQQWTG